MCFNPLHLFLRIPKIIQLCMLTAYSNRLREYFWQGRRNLRWIPCCVVTLQMGNGTFEKIRCIKWFLFCILKLLCATGWSLETMLNETNKPAKKKHGVASLIYQFTWYSGHCFWILVYHFSTQEHFHVLLMGYIANFLFCKSQASWYACFNCHICIFFFSKLILVTKSMTIELYVLIQ